TPVNNTTYSLNELEYINIFKKSRPIIKSLKNYKKKGNIYLQLDICNIKNSDKYTDIKYQIKYSRKSNFKSTKSTTIPQTSKSKYTRKQWKVAKNKTYYVKVRMSAKIKSGRRIYSRYSNTKKIKTPKK
ncbi:MAG: hypothetical protein K6G76_01230, partial [Lachnospiraceae bacterium]|nr:hypothetical protein [Lachnospiraceae bacterium]